jgi:hypothetical protein
MPVINGVYLKDFTALPDAVADANIIPIAISGNQVAYRTTVGGIVTDARVTGKLLTGLSVTGGAIASTDSILTAFGKVQNQLNSKVSSVGLTMPSAFSVANTPITSSGTLAVTANGLASQYIRGDGALADFPTGGGGGGSSVSYYLNGSVSQGTIGGNTYYEMNKVPVLGTGTDFSIGADGYIAQFLTDANDPNVLLIPGGNFNLEFYFSASSSGGTPSYYVELYKYNGTTFTLIASNSTSPELIAFGTNINPYFSSLAVPETVLLATDRLAIRIYVNHSGRTITLHTENSHLCQIITTFTTGLQSLNGLTKQTQYFAVGSTGTDFNIASSVDTHTFNLPTATATIRGALSSADWTMFNNKQNALTNPVTGTGTTNYVPKFTGASTIGNSLIYDNGTAVGIGTTNPNYLFQVKKATNVNFGINLQNAGISLEATNDAITAYIPMTYYASAHYLLDGNVGINTIANAGFRLDVNGTARFTSSIALTSASSSSSLTSTTNGIEISVDGSTSSNKNTIFKVGSSETMRIDASGNLGLGTTSPQAKLHSNSDILTGYFQNGTNGIYDALKLTNNTASNTLSGNGARIQFYNNTNNSTNLLGASIRSVNVDYGWASDLVLSSVQNNGYSTQTVNDAIWIKNTGNVGIGTTSPTTKLEVIANANTFQMARLENTNNTSGNGVLVTALGSNCNNTSSYHLIAATGGADKFYLYGNGTYTTVSDSRLKKDISKVTDNYLEKVLALNIVNYHWNDQNENDALEFGMIAQEVEELIPSIVHEGREDEKGNKYKGIQASVLPYILIKAIQELTEKVKQLENK